MMTKDRIIIIGAGPAGLGCAYKLTTSGKKNLNLVVLDKNSRPGGLARTTKYKGHFFDIGPHRFYTKNQEVFNFWKEILGKDLLKVNRMTRVLYKDKLFNYPIQFRDALPKLGMREALRGVFYFFYDSIHLKKIAPRTFEQAITKSFGRIFYQKFFKTYTEKVWGIKCNKIGSEWASQRIQGLNLPEIIKTALFGEKFRKATSLISSFYYPKKGAGQLYEKLTKKLESRGVEIALRTEAVEINYSRNKITNVAYLYKGKLCRLKTNYVFSSIPITSFILAMKPAVPEAVIEAAEQLQYRDHITVNLIIGGIKIFPDNWIYVHSPELKIARIANYSNFLPKKTRNKKTTPISVEYFSFEGDELWSLSDRELIRLATSELLKTGLIENLSVRDGFVVRESKSYPAYYLGYQKQFNVLKNYLKSFQNLQLIGRAGIYKYDNQDHATYSGFLAARNFLYGEKNDLWKINKDAEYLEVIKRENNRA